MVIDSVKTLNQLKETYKKSLDAQYKKVLICAGTGCVAGGSLDIYDKLLKMAQERGLKCSIELQKEPHEEIGFKKSGCHGFCEMGPLLRIEPHGWLYIKVKEEDCEEILEKSLIGDEPVERLLYQIDGKKYAAQEDIPFYKKQTRLVLEHCGHTDTESIEEYIAKGGYEAVAKALFEMKPQDIIDEISESNLRGRGAAASQQVENGRKWRGRQNL